MVPAPADPAREFRLFLAEWMRTARWTQHDLGAASGLGQSIISRWLNPDPYRRVQPTDDTLRRLAPVVGRSLDELLRMCGRRDIAAASAEEDPPELAALIADVRVGWHATDAGARQTAAAVTRAAFHVQRRRRPRGESTDQ